MSRTAIQRLCEANPVTDLPAPRPIETVLAGWGKTEAIARPRRWWGRMPGGLAAACGVAVAAAVVIVALGAIHGASRATPTASTSTLRYTSSEGFSVLYPSTFHLSQVASGEKYVPARQVTLASFPMRHTVVGVQRAGSRLELGDFPYDLPLDAGGQFPADGVALILQPSLVGVLGADSAFPTSLGQFGRANTEKFFTGAQDRRYAIPPALSHVLVGYSENFTATALIGADAPQTLRYALAAMVASLSFRRLAPGSHVPAGVVIGQASSYPVRSFTPLHIRFTDGQQTVYVVHAPGRLSYGNDCWVQAPCTPAGSFYAVGSQYNTRRNHAPACGLRLDRQDDDFYCTNLGVRWDRVGRVIALPASESYIGANETLNVKVAWDGQLLIQQGFGPEIGRAAVHRLWPSWNQPK
jgi:hypothetical protein